VLHLDRSNRVPLQGKELEAYMMEQVGEWEEGCVRGREVESGEERRQSQTVSDVKEAGRRQ